MKALFKSRKFRQGTMAAAITAAVVALVMVLNVLATALSSRYNLTLDLTANKLFSITDETKEYLSGLERDVTIYLLNNEEGFSGQDEYHLQAAEVLKKYAQSSGHINLEYVDLVANPAFAQNFPTLQLNSSSILLVCGEKVRDLTPYDLLDIEQNMYGQSQAVASKAEQVLTSAILAITSDHAVNVAVISGHNESDVTPFTSMLTSNNYMVSQVSLTGGGIDPMYHVAIVAGPERDFTEDELRQLDDFLENGGQYGKTLLYFANIQQTDLPNLSAFLEDWGIALGDGMVQETDSNRVFSYYGQPDPYIAQLDFAETEYAQGVQAADKLAVAAYGRQMELLFDSKDGITVTPLLQYAASAGVVQEAVQAEPGGEAIPFLTLSQKQRFEGSDLLNTQVVACSSTAMVEQMFLENPNFANGDYMLDLLAGLTHKEDAVRIQSKSLGGQTLDLSQLHVLVLGAVLTIVLPLMVLISGLVIWARRRHR